MGHCVKVYVRQNYNDCQNKRGMNIWKLHEALKKTTSTMRWFRISSTRAIAIVIASFKIVAMVDGGRIEYAT